MKNEDTILEVRGLKKAFKGQVVLDGVNVTFPRKRITAIFGQSGTGKSVLMKNLIGILDPDAGEILIDGQDVVGMSPDEKRKIRRRLGYLFQDAALFDSMNVGENIAFPLVEVLNIRDKLKIRRRVSELLEWVQLPGIESKMPESFPEVCESGSAWRVPWLRSRRSCSLTSRPPGLIRYSVIMYIN